MPLCPSTSKSAAVPPSRRSRGASPSPATKEMEARATERAWERYAESNLDHFLAFFCPRAWNDVDGMKGWQLLDGDSLPRCDLDGKVSTAYTLFRVRTRKEKEELFLHLHVKDGVVQVTSEDLSVLLIEEDVVVPVPVVHPDDSRRRPRLDWSPDGTATYGMRTTALFPAVVLDQYNALWRELEESPSPCALLVMAHLKARATRRRMSRRLRWKLRLFRRLARAPWSVQEKNDVATMIEHLLPLPKGLQQKFEKSTPGGRPWRQDDEC